MYYLYVCVISIVVIKNITVRVRKKKFVIDRLKYIGMPIFLPGPYYMSVKTGLTVIRKKNKKKMYKKVQKI